MGLAGRLRSNKVRVNYFVAETPMSDELRPDGRLVTGSEEDTIRLWTLPRPGQQSPGKADLIYHADGGINELAVTIRDGRTIIAAGDSLGRLHLLEYVDGRLATRIAT